MTAERVAKVIKREDIPLPKKQYPMMHRPMVTLSFSERIKRTHLVLHAIVSSFNAVREPVDLDLTMDTFADFLGIGRMEVYGAIHFGYMKDIIEYSNIDPEDRWVAITGQAIPALRDMMDITTLDAKVM